MVVRRPAGPRRRRSQPLPSCGHPLSITAPGLPTSATPGPKPARALQVNVIGTHHVLEAVRDAGLDCPVLVTGSALVYRPSVSPLSEDDPIGPSDPYGVSKLAQEMLVAAHESRAGLPRPAVQSRRAAPVRQLRDVEFRASDRGDRSRHAGPRPRSRQPRGRAGTSPTSATPCGRTGSLPQHGRPVRPYNVCSGIGYRVRDLLDILVAMSDRPIAVTPDPARFRPSDNPVITGNRSRIGAEARLGATDSDRAHPRRSARLLAREDTHLEPVVTPQAPRFSEGFRQIVHISMGAIALVLRFATWWEAAILAGVAVAINAHALHRLPGWSLYRESERGRRYLSGVTLYPLAIAVLILVLPARLDIVAAAWGILAFGDGMATVVGRRVRGAARFHGTRPSRWPGRQRSSCSAEPRDRSCACGAGRQSSPLRTCGFQSRCLWSRRLLPRPSRPSPSGSTTTCRCRQPRLRFSGGCRWSARMRSHRSPRRPVAAIATACRRECGRLDRRVFAAAP